MLFSSLHTLLYAITRDLLQAVVVQPRSVHELSDRSIRNRLVFLDVTSTYFRASFPCGTHTLPSTVMYILNTSNKPRRQSVSRMQARHVLAVTIDRKADRSVAPIIGGKHLLALTYAATGRVHANPAAIRDVIVGRDGMVKGAC